MYTAYIRLLPPAYDPALAGFCGGPMSDTRWPAPTLYTPACMLLRYLVLGLV